MERRKFLKNTGLGLVGLAIANQSLAKSITSHNMSKNVYLLISGGIAYDDFMSAFESSFLKEFQANNNLKIDFNTQVNYDGAVLEHAESLCSLLNKLELNNRQAVFISNNNSHTTKAVEQLQLPFEIKKTQSSISELPYRNDEMIFVAAHKAISDYQEIYLNLEDTDIAHSNKSYYKDVLIYYNQAIGELCKKLFSHQETAKNSCLHIMSTLGRNSTNCNLYDNADGNSSSHHYHESARKLFSIHISGADYYQLV